jgi:hypothetical protein
MISLSYFTSFYELEGKPPGFFLSFELFSIFNSVISIVN